MTVPFYSKDDVNRIANEFLSKYMVSPQIPVPIEEIAEVDLNLEILPLIGFKKRFGCDGYLSTDCSMITVDEDVMKKYPPRYRFTLAHEVGHYILHGDYIRNNVPTTTQDWKNLMLRQSGSESAWPEQHANWFANAVLVPPKLLLLAWEDALGIVSARQISMSDYAAATLRGILPKSFRFQRQLLKLPFDVTD